jgi:hypothetical protein
MKRCPKCGSSHPHLHPAVQFEGEVETCVHDFHLTATPQNTPAYIAAVWAKRSTLTKEPTDEQ